MIDEDNDKKYIIASLEKNMIRANSTVVLML